MIALQDPYGTCVIELMSELEQVLAEGAECEAPVGAPLTEVSPTVPRLRQSASQQNS